MKLSDIKDGIDLIIGDTPLLYDLSVTTPPLS